MSTKNKKNQNEKEFSGKFLAFTAQSVVETNVDRVDFELVDDSDQSQSKLEREYTKLLVKWEILLTKNIACSQWSNSDLWTYSIWVEDWIGYQRWVNSQRTYSWREFNKIIRISKVECEDDGYYINTG